jgi:flavorubredoxin
MAVELKKDIHWVGVVDWGLRHFHGQELSTHRGSSYNAYLIRDQKNVLVDTVWEPFAEEFIAGLRKEIDLAKIDYIIANHAEPDHSGALPALMRLCPNATIVLSKRGMDSIPGHYHQPWKFQTVGTGDSLNIGRRELRFIEATMLHWPDTMFAYVAGDNILLSNDAFGQHYATAFRWNDQVDQAELFEEAIKYYANILTPYSKQVTKKIEEFAALNWPVDMICPSHGVLWRDDPMQIVHKYLAWAAQKGEKRAVIIFDTMWNATRKMAEAIGAGLTERGVPNKLFYMALSDHNDVVTEILRSKAVVIGSPTHNRGLLPSIMPILEDIRGLKFQNKVGAAFGSYGWAGESVKILEELLAKSGIPLAAPGVLAKWQPTDDDLAKCRQLGYAVADAVNKE